MNDFGGLGIQGFKPIRVTVAKGGDCHPGCQVQVLSPLDIVEITPLSPLKGDLGVAQKGNLEIGSDSDSDLGSGSDPEIQIQIQIPEVVKVVKENTFCFL